MMVLQISWSCFILSQDEIWSDKKWSDFRYVAGGADKFPKGLEVECEMEESRMAPRFWSWEAEKHEAADKLEGWKGASLEKITSPVLAWVWNVC